MVAPFEIREDQDIPENKTQLLELISAKKALPFHAKICRNCHAIPKELEWLNTSETTEMNLFSQTKRLNEFKDWEPFYIGTNKEPYFDERISREGHSNKRIQNYAMCLLDYDYFVLNNAFLIHTGFRIDSWDNNPMNYKYKMLTDKLIQKVIVPGYKILYGDRKGCTV